MRAGGILSILLVSVGVGTIPVWANGDGGGGSMGNNEMPSVSTPRYDPAKEYQAGVAALQASDFKTADKSFDHVLSVAPKNENTLVLSGFAKAQLSNFKGARDAYKKALSVNDKNVMARKGYALALVSLGDKDGATKELDTLKKSADSCGDSCADATALKGAVTAVGDALNAPGKQSYLAPPTPLMGSAQGGDHAYMQAVADINQHHYPAALKSLTAAEAIFGPHPDVLTYIGFTYRKLGRYDTAETYYRQALTIAPNHRGATEYYGELKVERGDVQGARQMLDKLDNLCKFGCVEAEDLRRWIALGHG